MVSVVVPVYNGERYLARCIESVLRQTYENWRLVVFNNCSTDGTLALAERYASMDSRITVLTGPDFVGAECNHNRALRCISADSQYVKVVFADDFLFPNCLREMVTLARENPSVGLVGSYALRGRRVMWTGLPCDRSVYSGREVCRMRLLGGEYVFGTPSSLLMRADLVRSRPMFYDESNEHADTEVCYALLRDCDFGFVHQVLSYSHEEEGSLRTESRRRNSYLPAFLHDLKTHGPAFLTEGELAGAIGLRLKIYYDFLARSVMRREGTEFWRYHEHMLRELGYPLQRPRLALCVAAYVLDALLNPKRTIENAWRTLGRGHSGGH